MRMGITLVFGSYGNCGANDRRMMRALPLHRDSHGIHGTHGNPPAAHPWRLFPSLHLLFWYPSAHRRVNLREGCGENQTLLAIPSIGITFPGNTG